MKVQVERVLYDSPDTGFHICKAAVLWRRRRRI